MKLIIKGVCFLIVLLVISALKVSAGVSIQLIQTFDYPGAVSTQPQKMNSQRQIVGVYTDSSAIQRGFVRFKDGSYSDPLVDPDDTGGITQLRGVNDSRLMCGDYLDSSTGNYHGFFLQGTTFDNYDVPGSTWTIVLGLNNAGDFCGSDIPASGVQSGFVSIGGAITEFTVQDATNTLAYQLNKHNQSAGYYIDSAGISHGYYRNGDGSIVAPIDPAGTTGTIVFGNNDSNWIVGRYPDASGVTHGFLFIPPNRYVTYDFPGSTFTSLNGITSRGLIVGRYLDASGVEHGLLARAVSSASDQSVSGTTPYLQAPGSGNVSAGIRLEDPAF